MLEDPQGQLEKKRRYNKAQYEKHKRLVALGRSLDLQE